MRKKLELTGQKFGRLTAIKRCDAKKDRKHIWLWQCDCGVKKEIVGCHVKDGRISSCGCLQIERSTTHGMRKSHTYNSWARMKDRCNNQHDKNYDSYGGRGISVCAQWNKFENFYADMGEKPKGMTIERIDNDGNYEPKNCRWATQKEQCRNTRKNRLVQYQGEVKCLSEWSEILNISRGTLHSRLKIYPPSLAFTLKKYKNRPNVKER